MPRSKIALLYVGGSIGMVMNQKTHRIEPLESLGIIHKAIPDLQKEVALDFFSLSNVGSSEITPDHWVQIAEHIKDIYDDYEGFVVVHGTNTMAYSASALSFALQNLSKPVVFTGALLPLNELAGDGRMNLIFAVRTALLDLAEVVIALGPRVLRATRAKKVADSYLQTFDSPTLNPLVDFSTDVKLSPDRQVRRKRALSYKPTFDSNVIALTLTPGMPDSMLQAALAAKPHGIVLRAYGPGMFPESLFPWLRELSAAKIPIVMTSQSLRSGIDLHRFRKQLALEDLGVISAKNMTFEAAFVKLMWALQQGATGTRLRDLMEKSLVGELDE